MPLWLLATIRVSGLRLGGLSIRSSSGMPRSWIHHFPLHSDGGSGRDAEKKKRREVNLWGFPWTTFAIKQILIVRYIQDGQFVTIWALFFSPTEVVFGSSCKDTELQLIITKCKYYLLLFFFFGQFKRCVWHALGCDFIYFKLMQLEAWKLISERFPNDLIIMSSDMFSWKWRLLILFLFHWHMNPPSNLNFQWTLTRYICICVSINEYNIFIG